LNPSISRLGDDLDALPLVLLDRQLGGVEEDGVPALREAGADHVPFRAVVQVQRDRDPHVFRVRHPHGVHGVQAGHLHVLDRGLEDDGRPELLCGSQDCLHRKVVDHVDRRDAVSLGERAIENLPGWHNWHASTSSRNAIHLGVRDARKHCDLGTNPMRV
jgi:hypothetical protein